MIYGLDVPCCDNQCRLASRPAPHDMIVTSKPLTRVEAAPNTNGMRVNLDVSSRAAVLAPATVTRMGGNRLV